MLKPAQNYRGDLNDKHVDCWYDPKYMYARSSVCSYEIDIPNDNEHEHCFVSVQCGCVIGYISYTVDWTARSAEDLFIENFEIGNPLFIKDAFTAICDIFEKYNLNRLEWTCIADNPVIKGYRRFIEKCNGREVGTLKDKVMLEDGKLHDLVYFEIFADEFLSWRSSQKMKKSK